MTYTFQIECIQYIASGRGLLTIKYVHLRKWSCVQLWVI